MKYAYWVTFVRTARDQTQKIDATYVLLDKEITSCADIQQILQKIGEQNNTGMRSPPCDYTVLSWTRLPGNDKPA